MGTNVASGVATTDLLLSVAEQLKVPLTAIARQAELGQLTGYLEPAGVELIHSQAEAATHLVESYLLGLQLLQGQGSLPLEPVSVSSLLTDSAHELQAYARQYGVELEVRIAGRYQPVMAHNQGLRAAVLSLAYGLIEAQAAQPRVKGHARLALAAHRASHGIVTGIYGEYEGLSAQAWRQALRLSGRAHQPFVGLSPSASAGLFVADTILRAMSSCLRVGRYLNQAGLGATLLPSQQLQLV